MHQPDQELGTIHPQEGGVDAKASSNESPTKVIKEQNSAGGLTSTPIAHDKQRTSNDNSYLSRRNLGILKEAEGSQKSIESSSWDPREPPDSKNRTTEKPDDHQSLLALLSVDQDHLDQEEDWNDISLHGPRHRGPRVTLIIHRED